MSLVQFHRILIATAIVFCFGYGIWEAVRRGPTPLALLFIALGVGLAFYLRRLNRFLGLDKPDNGPSRKEK